MGWGLPHGLPQIHFSFDPSFSHVLQAVNPVLPIIISRAQIPDGAGFDVPDLKKRGKA